MKKDLEKKPIEQHASYKDILGDLNLEKTYKKYGEKNVKWALNRFLKEQRERAALLKQKADAESKLKELNSR